MSSTKQKQPREVVDYDLRMIDYFEDVGDSDEIDTVTELEVDTVTVPPLEFGPGVHPTFALVGDPAYIAKIWVGGGVDKQKYKITALITTVLERVEEVEFYVKVKET